MAKLRIVVEVDIPEYEDIPRVAAMVPELVMATTRTVQTITGQFECQGHGIVMGDGMENMPEPPMPPMGSARRPRRLR